LAEVKILIALLIALYTLCGMLSQITCSTGLSSATNFGFIEHLSINTTWN